MPPKGRGTGTKWATIRFGDISARTDRVAIVVNNATGGGYYNCYLQNLYAGANWNVSSRDVLSDDYTAGLVVVLNLAEHNSTTHDLAGRTVLDVWQKFDRAAGSQGWCWVGHDP